MGISWPTHLAPDSDEKQVILQASEVLPLTNHQVTTIDVDVHPSRHLYSNTSPTWRNMSTGPPCCALSTRNRKTPAKKKTQLSQLILSSNIEKIENDSAGTSEDVTTSPSPNIHGQTPPKIRKRSPMAGTNPESSETFPGVQRKNPPG